MFNKEFPNDTLKSIFNILINNSINYLQEQDTLIYIKKIMIMLLMIQKIKIFQICQMYQI